MSLSVRAGKAMDKVYLRLRDPKAFGVTSGEAGTFDTLRGRKYALIVTFRRNGTAVPTPIWFGLGEDGNAYTHTFADAGKVKRLRNNPRALLARHATKLHRPHPLAAARLRFHAASAASPARLWPLLTSALGPQSAEAAACARSAPAATKQKRRDRAELGVRSPPFRG
jgi:hypothetical protein